MHDIKESAAVLRAALAGTTMEGTVDFKVRSIEVMRLAERSRSFVGRGPEYDDVLPEFDKAVMTYSALTCEEGYVPAFTILKGCVVGLRERLMTSWSDDIMAISDRLRENLPPKKVLDDPLFLVNSEMQSLITEHKALGTWVADTNSLTTKLGVLKKMQASGFALDRGLKSTHNVGLAVKKDAKQVLAVEFVLQKLKKLPDDSTQTMTNFAEQVEAKMEQMKVPLPAAMGKALTLMKKKQM